ncbi:MAG: hypothetical protein C4537_06155 [Acholeplasma sp.]|jgi:uridine kinase|nr:MAG: hypothetical protein C4537_06155 [Acholeplasma sp.]
MKNIITLIEWKHILNELIKQNETPYVIAIDGDAASGKTTFSQQFANNPLIWIVSMDHFYLPLDQRMDAVGGHMDYDKLIQGVFIPHSHHQSMHYTWYDPHTTKIIQDIHLAYRPIIILEGAYSCHPKLRQWITLSAMFTINDELQRTRIIQRSNQVTYDKFHDIWIPKEKNYQKQTKLDQYVNYHIHVKE